MVRAQLPSVASSDDIGVAERSERFVRLLASEKAAPALPWLSSRATPGGTAAAEAAADLDDEDDLDDDELQRDNRD